VLAWVFPPSTGQDAAERLKIPPGAELLSPLAFDSIMMFLFNAMGKYFFAP
jgi:hypothetical protein